MISKITVKGAVQGVGYRPFILRKATEYGISGFVKNIGAAVEILAIGEDRKVSEFTLVLSGEYPAGAFILSVEETMLSRDELSSYLSDNGISDFPADIDDSSLCHNQDFRIIESSELDLSSEIPVFLPDIGICDECLTEMLDEKDRRYGYPLISCASCGPRISILDKLPYDRDTTAMVDFEMCPSCEGEYKTGRRLHAQTISCHSCGPQIELALWDRDMSLLPESIMIYQQEGFSIVSKESSIAAAIKLLNQGKILGLKGVSGYQLVCQSTDEAAHNLREIKGREKKPFAVMFSDIDCIREYCNVSSKEEELLRSSARPIVLLTRKKDLPYEVCGDSRYIGAFLPSTGIHRLLCDGCGPLIVTSANRSGEPIITEDEAFNKAFISSGVSGVLFHKRRINMPQDDSVAFVCRLQDGSEIACFNRRARGYVPLPVLTKGIGKKVLAFGADLKSTFSFGYKDKILPSQYLGDLQDFGVNTNFKRLLGQFQDIFKFEPQVIVCDMHPLYESVREATDYSKSQNLPLFKVQHHHAHILSVMAEKSLKSCIGISFDGTGMGTDGNIWGGEFLYCAGQSFDRKAHLSYVKLCGGDNASRNAKLVKECYDYAMGKELPKASNLIKAALENNVNCFLTSSMGRLFDAACACLEIKMENSYEGECGISLEKCAWDYIDSSAQSDLAFDIDDEADVLSFDIKEGENGLIIDQVRMIDDLQRAYEKGHKSRERLAFEFHMAIISAACKICQAIKRETGENKVCLSGGVFGNRLLLSGTIDKLKSLGFEVYINELVPASDAGISVGQAYFLALEEV